MRVAKQSIILWLGLLLVLSTRIPTSTYEYGWDTYFIHSLANSLVSNNYAKWNLDLLSVAGLSDFSYPSGMAYLLAIVNQVTEIGIPTCIFLVSIGICVTGYFLMFALCRMINISKIVSIVAAILFSIAPAFFQVTFWQASARGLITLLGLATLFLILRFVLSHKLRYITLSLMLSVIGFTIHRNAFFVSIYFLGFLISILLFAFSRTHSYTKNANFCVRVLITFICVASFSIPFIFNHFYRSFWWQYKSGGFIDSSSSVALAANIAINYGSRIGPILLFVPLGFVLMLVSNYGVEYAVVFISLGLSLAFFPLGQYVVLFMLPCMILVGLLGLVRILSFAAKKNVSTYVYALMLLSTVLLTLYMSHYWANKYDQLGDSVSISKSDYQLANYLKLQATNVTIFDNGILVSRIIPISQIPSMPARDPLYLATGLIDKEDIKPKPLSFNSFLKYWSFAKSYPNAPFEHASYFNYSQSDAVDFVLHYNVLYYVADFTEGGSFYFNYKLFRSLRADKNLIYSTNKRGVFQI